MYLVGKLYSSIGLEIFNCPDYNDTSPKLKTLGTATKVLPYLKEMQISVSTYPLHVCMCLLRNMYIVLSVCIYIFDMMLIIS